LRQGHLKLRPNRSFTARLFGPHHPDATREPTTTSTSNLGVASTDNCKMKPGASSLLSNAFAGLRISPLYALRPALITAQSTRPTASPSPSTDPQNARAFSSTPSQLGSWLEPSIDRRKKMMKGRARCPTGGSSRGTTVIWGDYGLRMSDHHRRISAKQLKVAEDTIKQRLRGQKYRLYKRVSCNVGVFVSGNEVCLCLPLDERGANRASELRREDYRCVWVKERAPSTTGPRAWPSTRSSSRSEACSTSRSCATLSGWRGTNCLVCYSHSPLPPMSSARIPRGISLLTLCAPPGQHEFVKKGDPPVVGITKLDGITLEELKRPRRKLPTVEVPPAVSPAVATTPSSTNPTA